MLSATTWLYRAQVPTLRLQSETISASLCRSFHLPCSPLLSSACSLTGAPIQDHLPRSLAPCIRLALRSFPLPARSLFLGRVREGGGESRGVVLRIDGEDLYYVQLSSGEGYKTCRSAQMRLEKPAEEVISTLTAMGFARPEVATALKFAYYDAVVASEYLLNGIIPEDVQRTVLMQEEEAAKVALAKAAEKAAAEKEAAEKAAEKAAVEKLAAVKAEAEAAAAAPSSSVAGALPGDLCATVTFRFKRRPPEVHTLVRVPPGGLAFGASLRKAGHGLTLHSFTVDKRACEQLLRDNLEAAQEVAEASMSVPSALQADELTITPRLAAVEATMEHLRAEGLQVESSLVAMVHASLPALRQAASIERLRRVTLSHDPDAIGRALEEAKAHQVDGRSDGAVLVAKAEARRGELEAPLPLSLPGALRFERASVGAKLLCNGLAAQKVGWGGDDSCCLLSPALHAGRTKVSFRLDFAPTSSSRTAIGVFRADVNSGQQGALEQGCALIASGPPRAQGRNHGWGSGQARLVCNGESTDVGKDLRWAAGDIVEVGVAFESDTSARGLHPTDRLQGTFSPPLPSLLTSPADTPISARQCP